MLLVPFRKPLPGFFGSGPPGAPIFVFDWMAVPEGLLDGSASSRLYGAWVTSMTAFFSEDDQTVGDPSATGGSTSLHMSFQSP
ncbi:MAG: hypothetical protein D6740_12535 [Alphaproteobacteria bacterium]|nr:MAG: hypothetical protein D6740_12535 [Alphaproteobacteria bacterium]